MGIPAGRILTAGRGRREPLIPAVDLCSPELLEPTMCLRDDVVQRGELDRKLFDEVGLLGDHAHMSRQIRALPDEQAAQVHLELRTVEHPEVAGEALDSDARAGAADHRVEQVVRVIQVTLRVRRQAPPERVGDVRQRTLEVGRQLPGVVAARPAPDAVALDKEDAGARGAQEEERRRDPGDPGADDQHVDRRVGCKRLRRTVRLALSQPRRPVLAVGVERKRLRCRSLSQRERDLNLRHGASGPRSRDPRCCACRRNRPL